MKKVNLEGIKPTSTPAALGQTLSKHDGTILVDCTLYRSTIDALHYLTVTMPNISYIVGQLSQFLQSPIDLHWLVYNRVLRYLKGNMNKGLHFSTSPFSSSVLLRGFVDVDWATY